MKRRSPGFTGERLKEARYARGITQAKLANLLGLKSRQIIARYEAGDVTPHPELVQEIAKVLNLPVEFFFRAPEAQEETTIFFRSMHATTERARKSAETKHGWLMRITASTDDFIELPSPNFPELSFGPNPLVIGLEDIESAAAYLRDYWGLKNGAISNVVYLLENNGAIVARIDLDAKSLDAISGRSPKTGRPYFILNSEKDSAVRSRFDAAHELGHMILHREITSELLRDTTMFKLIEKQAHRFASAFLLPAPTFADDFLQEITSLDALLRLKIKWKVSLAAIIMRARDLELISHDTENKLQRNLSARGYRKREPYDDVIPMEEPELLRQALSMLRESRYLDDLFSELPYGASEIEQLGSLPQGYFNERRLRVLAPRQKARGTDEVPEVSSVIQFPKPTKS